MELTLEVTQRLAAIAREHEPVTTTDGFIDCSCGWESNHPLAWSRAEMKQQADPERPDPVDATGEPDPEHTGNPEPQQEHVAALQLAFLQTAQ
jgi:hypothetical protein